MARNESTKAQLLFAGKEKWSSLGQDCSSEVPGKTAHT